MAAILFHEPVFATIVESGDKLYFYEVGTTTDLTVYTDFALSAAATQPVIADSDGRFPPLYIDSTGNDPKIVLHDANDAQKWTCPRYPIEDLSALAAEVGDAVSDVEAMEGRVAGNEEDIDTLSIESADFETRITALEAGGGGVNTEIFTGSGTYTKPEGLKKAKVTVIGGGGGGVGFNLSTCGGAGGGCAIKWIDAGSIGETETVTVGIGGNGQSGSPGNAGGSTSFGAHCSATGGEGGRSQSAVPSDGGVGSGGDINANGGTPTLQLAGSGTDAIPGGGSYLGFSAVNGAPTTPGAGGACVLSGAGEDGANGIVIVEEFF